MSTYIFAGDSWALKGFTEENYAVANQEPLPQDIRLADFWNLDYQTIVTPGRGNLACLDKIVQANINPNLPIIWVYTEPGRDFGTITGDEEFGWITSEEIFDIRQKLDTFILNKIADTLPNPIALIGGLSDINEKLALELGFSVIHSSWQNWIAQQCNSQWFEFGWGASDIGWRHDYNNVKPSKSALFEWDKQIKEWCYWEEYNLFSHEHPSIKANKLFAHYLKDDVLKWLHKNAK